MANDKWKDHLMKTGFPLEYIVRNVLNDIGHKTLGSFPYIRPDENDIKREFSVDLKTIKNIYQDNERFQLNFLIECKYRRPNTTWLFSKYPDHYINYGLINSTHFLTPDIPLVDSRFDFERSLIYCDNGTEINDSTAKSDELKHGVYQLMFCQPVIYKILCINTLQSGVLNFLCPILITTSEIRVLNDSLNIDDFLKAKDLNDISEIKDAIIFSEESGPQLSVFAASMVDELIHQYPELIKRVNKLSSLHERDRNASFYDVPFLFSLFQELINKVLIINFESLSTVISKIESSINQDFTNRSSFGKLKVEKDAIKLFDNNGNLFSDFKSN